MDYMDKNDIDLRIQKLERMIAELKQTIRPQSPDASAPSDQAPVHAIPNAPATSLQDACPRPETPSDPRVTSEDNTPHQSPSDEINSEQDNTTQENTHQNDDPHHCRSTIPVSFSIQDQSFPLKEQTWPALLAEIVEYVIHQGTIPYLQNRIANRSKFVPLLRNLRIFNTFEAAEAEKDAVYQTDLSNQQYLCIYTQDPQTIINTFSAFCKMCNIPINTIQIERKKIDTPSHSPNDLHDNHNDEDDDNHNSIDDLNDNHDEDINDDKHAVYQLTFAYPEKAINTIPLTCNIQNLPLKFSPKNWPTLLSEFIKLISNTSIPAFWFKIQSHISTTPILQNILISRSVPDLYTNHPSFKLTDRWSLILYTQKPKDIVLIIQALCELFAIPTKQVIITYTPLPSSSVNPGDDKIEDESKVENNGEDDDDEDYEDYEDDDDDESDEFDEDDDEDSDDDESDEFDEDDDEESDDDDKDDDEESDENGENTLEPCTIVNLTTPDAYKGTKPIYCTIKNDNLILFQKTWGELLVTIVEYLSRQKDDLTDRLIHTPILGKRPIVSKIKPKFARKSSRNGRKSPNHKKLSNGHYLIVNYSCREIIRIIKKLLEFCDLSTHDIRIGCQSPDTENNHAFPTNAPSSAISKSVDFEIPEYPQPTVQANTLSTRTVRLNFNTPEKYTKKSPVSCTIDGKPIHYPNSQWKDLLPAFVNHAIDEHWPNLDRLSYQTLPRERAAFFQRTPLSSRTDGVKWVKCHNNLYIRTTRSAVSHIQAIAGICQFCQISLDRVAIYISTNTDDDDELSPAMTSISPDRPSAYDTPETFKSPSPIQNPPGISAQDSVIKRALNENTINTKSTATPQYRAQTRYVTQLSTQIRKHISKIYTHLPHHRDDRQTMNSNTPLRVHFGRPELCVHSNPTCCCFRNSVLVVGKFSWGELIVCFLEELIKLDAPNLDSLRYEPILGSRILFLPEKPRGKNIVQLSNGYYLNATFRPEVAVIVLRRLCERCGIDTSDLVIEYTPKTSVATPTHATTTQAPVSHHDTLSPPSHTEDACKARFKAYLQQTMAATTVNIYSAAIDQISKFARDRQICRTTLYILDDANTLQTILDALLKDPKFVQWDQQKHHYLKSALLKLIEFHQQKADFFKFIEDHRQIQNDDDASPSQYDTDAHTQAPQSLSTSYASAHTQPNPLSPLAQLILEHFPDGLQLGILDITKLRNAANDADLPLPSDDNALKNRIAQCGLQIDNMVYVIDPMSVQRIQALLQRDIDDGHAIFFYNQWFNAHRQILEAAHIHESILQPWLKKTFPNLYFYEYHFGTTDKKQFKGIKREILKFWNDDPKLNVAQIQERLPYIPSEDILQTLKKDDGFIYESRDTFARLGDFDITPEHKENLLNDVKDMFYANAPVLLSKLPLDDIIQHNWKLETLSHPAFENAAYALCLKQDYDIIGNVNSTDRRLVQKNAQTDAPDDSNALEKLYQDIDHQCTKQELFEIQKEAIGTNGHMQVCLTAIKTLIQISEDEFVPKNFLSFDIEAIDDAIDDMLQRAQKAYMPLKAFTSFFGFPDCHYPWNPYILQGYVRHFSRRFTIMQPAVNFSCIGAVVKKDWFDAYKELMADAVVAAHIPLTIEDVGDFLIERGYIGLRRTQTLEEILTLANSL